MIPYIDSHNHMHTLSWDEWELLSMAGMEAAVLSLGAPQVHREIWTEPPSAEDIRRYWDHPIRLARVSEEKHFLRVRCAVGISFQTKVMGWKKLLDALPEYLADPHVVALGEVGIDPTQYFGFPWPLDDQRRCLEAQLRIAAERDKPVILHTPTPKERGSFSAELSIQGEVPPEEYRLHYLRLDMEAVEAAGLDHGRLVVDHVDGSVIDFVHRQTGAWCGISIGSNLRPIRPQQIVEWVRTYGPERIMLNSDHVGYRSIDLFSLPKALRVLWRAGIPAADIRRVCFENANRFYRLGL